MAFKFQGKEMYPIFVFAKWCWPMRTANREKLLPHNLSSFISSLCAYPASSASI